MIYRPNIPSRDKTGMGYASSVEMPHAVSVALFGNIHKRFFSRLKNIVFFKAFQMAANVLKYIR